ncbi:similar to pheromone shutdown protein TraB [Cyanidioschyzon merolae strain 10D]|uniref:Similar to pheromone shutdown protein TraB n=1 Tax=Cyanidioschyzon merolae (strain NIES-3377 / 10D) TaxID=280699 RepID=M1VIK7_CYAM1|nr:similar to pheromone shutdown protein TraB [Cyanidioschyzon merolae strain 10D]BAM83422.1 similar to pheromone shutdown protein TraB [Cyanidioschyzon merolae strain 10D]|eukprot:XP_005539458.1 similar to pheromone shutdown protein TraB [Cyanidioschyzon merolae strain 10D]
MSTVAVRARWLSGIWRWRGFRQFVRSEQWWRREPRPAAYRTLVPQAQPAFRVWVSGSLSTSAGNSTFGSAPGDETTNSTGTAAALTDDNPLRLVNGSTGAVAHVLGTAHISALSVSQTRELIRRVQPDTVVVELDDERVQTVRERLDKKDPSQDSSLFSELLRVFTDPRGGSLGSRMFEVYFKLMYRALRMAGFLPGAEFVAAIEEAERIGARVVLGDRNIHETMERLRAAVFHNFSDVLHALVSPPPPELESLLDNLKDQARGGNARKISTDFVDALLDRKSVRLLTRFLSRSLPAVSKVMLDERDVILASKIATAPGQKIVAIVGAAHLDGIERWWLQNIEPDPIIVSSSPLPSQS